MPPPGGKTTPLNVSYGWGSSLGADPQLAARYGWGAPSSLAGAQDLAQRFRDQFQPDHGIFAPNYPLMPPMREYLRLWDYPVGYNFIFQPRSYEPVKFEELHHFA